MVVRHDGARLARYDQTGGDAIRAVALRTGPLRARVRNLSVPRANVLRVEAEAASVVFLVNDKQVAEIPRDGAIYDGIVGLRVGSDLNLHVTNLDVTHRLALPRRAKQP